MIYRHATNVNSQHIEGSDEDKQDMDLGGQNGSVSSRKDPKGYG
jgi:hypothetical protein